MAMEKVYKRTIGVKPNAVSGFCPGCMHGTIHKLIGEVVEELGEKANGRFADLQVVEIPDGMIYDIDNYDGIEKLHESVRVW